VKKPHNGSIVYELNSTEVACWVRMEMTTFLKGFSSMLVVREQAISVIVKNVLIAPSPESLAENICIEHDSGLEVPAGHKMD